MKKFGYYDPRPRGDHKTRVVENPKTTGSEPEIATNLVRRIEQGDSAAESEFFLRYGRGVLYFITRKTGDPDLAEDLRQETFRIVLERLRSRGLEEPEKLAAFVHGTASNLIMANRQKEYRRKTDTDSELLDNVADDHDEVVDEVSRDDEAAVIRKLLDEMRTDRDREILWRFYIHEEDKTVICTDLGLSDLHFNRVLFRARQRFKTLLEKRMRRENLAIVG
ncbi:MAG: sigma-70 family RNA polymerase sigma factor [Gammaproteobacteria bacterium]|nr:sigma-70 family RNA polymerase sigma factor [Gammaproteobacteria bacterium]